MTSEEIDAEIVDGAARLFARHGFRQTSLQAVADEVGYSKTGLLHRFSSKDALWEAVVTDFRRQIATVTESVLDLPPGEVRDRAVIEAVLDIGVRRPGFVRLMFSLLTLPEGDPDAALLEEAPLGLLEAFGVPVSAMTPAPAPGGAPAHAALGPVGVDHVVEVDPDRTVPILGALGVLAISIFLLETHAGARPLVVQSAMRVLGHR